MSNKHNESINYEFSLIGYDSAGDRGLMGIDDNTYHVYKFLKQQKRITKDCYITMQEAKKITYNKTQTRGGRNTSRVLNMLISN